MEDNTTAARKMSPPVVIVTCPGGGGHEWAKINPRWLVPETGKGRPRSQRGTFWCPDHQDEKNLHIRTKIQESHKKVASEYAALPLPSTKRCSNPNPESHVPGAVFPSGKFYRRVSKRSDGSVYEVLHSRCKECIKRQNARHRESLDQEELRRKSREGWDRWKEKRDKDRLRLGREGDKWLPIAPFKEWWTAYYRASDESMSGIARRAGVNDVTLRNVACVELKEYISMSIVDKVGVACGYPDLLYQLYPLMDAEAAA